MKTKVLSIENKTEHLGRHVWENDDLHLVDTIIEMFQFGICPDNKLGKKNTYLWLPGKAYEDIFVGGLFGVGPPITNSSSSNHSHRFYKTYVSIEKVQFPTQDTLMNT